MRKQSRNLVGLRFGRLVVTEKTDMFDAFHANRFWNCQCDCGRTHLVPASALLAGSTKSCGCLKREVAARSGKRNLIDMVGKTFGRLTVISLSDKRSTAGFARWLCRCSCGNEKIICGVYLRNGNTTSCGCHRRRIAGNRLRTPARTPVPEYRIWSHMKSRCCNPTANNFERYGGRGIIVCDRWKSFSLFFEDMGSRPSQKHSIERIDNEGNYTPENCRWATAKEQANNTRRTVWLTYNGETRVLTDWSQHLRISKDVIKQRLRLGWTVERTLTEPVQSKFGRPKQAKHVNSHLPAG